MDKTNTGTLGKNKRKTQDNHPTHAGQINVEGEGYWLSARVKENKETGEKFFSLSLKKKKPKPEPAAETATAPWEKADDIPF